MVLFEEISDSSFGVSLFRVMSNTGVKRRMSKLVASDTATMEECGLSGGSFELEELKFRLFKDSTSCDSTSTSARAAAPAVDKNLSTVKRLTSCLIRLVP